MMKTQFVMLRNIRDGDHKSPTMMFVNPAHVVFIELCRIRDCTAVATTGGRLYTSEDFETVARKLTTALP